MREQERRRAVVFERDEHVRAEASGRHMPDALGLQAFHEVFVKIVGRRRIARRVESRAASLAAVGVERENSPQRMSRKKFRWMMFMIYE